MGDTPQRVGLGYGEDDGGGPRHQIVKLGLRLATIRPRDQFVGELSVRTAEDQLPGRGMRQEDRIGGSLSDMQAIDLALELSSEVVATVGACRRGRKGD